MVDRIKFRIGVLLQELSNNLLRGPNPDRTDVELLLFVDTFTNFDIESGQFRTNSMPAAICAEDPSVPGDLLDGFSDS